jgi:ADP-ribose pyrophosphatase
MEAWVHSERLYEGKVVALRVGEVRMDKGTIAFREVVEHPGGVAIVPVRDEAAILIRQYRIAIGQEILELPAGKLEGAEDLEYRGRCELKQETGYRARRLVPAGTVYASVGYSSEEIRFFLAFDLEHVGQNLEVDESIETVSLPVREIEARLAHNELKDAKTIVGLHALLNYLRPLDQTSGDAT